MGQEYTLEKDAKYLLFSFFLRKRRRGRRRRRRKNTYTSDMLLIELPGIKKLIMKITTLWMSFDGLLTASKDMP